MIYADNYDTLAEDIWKKKINLKKKWEVCWKVIV